jgi:hypothetical protein
VRFRTPEPASGTHSQSNRPTISRVWSPIDAEPLLQVGRDNFEPAPRELQGYGVASPRVFYSTTVSSAGPVEADPSLLACCFRAKPALTIGSGASASTRQRLTSFTDALGPLMPSGKSLLDGPPIVTVA